MPFDAPTLDTTTEPTTDDLRHILRVVHIRPSGPRGGRPIERDYMIDAAGVQILLDSLPPSDRLRIGDREFACRGGGPAAQTAALVPLMTPEQVAIEVSRLQNRNFIDDMEDMRRRFMDGHKQILAAAADSLKVVAAMQDQVMANTERMVEAMEKAAQKQSGDLVEQVVSALVSQMQPQAGGLLGALAARRGAG